MKAYVDIHDKRWNKYKVDFGKVVCAAVECVHKDSEVSIILTNDSEIQQINREYRGIDKPTNVLSFELGDDVLLGDIYVSLDTVLREAKDANISVQNHVIHMIVHGVLHLQGYDHINDDDATVMENKEIKILKKLNIANPYSDDVVCAGGLCCPGAKTIAFLNRLKVGAVKSNTTVLQNLKKLTVFLKLPPNTASLKVKRLFPPLVLTISILTFPAKNSF